MFSRCLLACCLVGCASESSSEKTRDGADTPDEAADPRVLFIGIDGMRPDALDAADTPHIDRLRREGAGSLSAATQLTGATSSAPGWTSIFTGVEVRTHGVVQNGDYSGYDTTLPTFARLVRHDLGRPTAAVAHWPQILSDIHQVDDFDSSLLTDDDGVADVTSDNIQVGSAHLYVTHLDDVDHAGHAEGFSVEVPEYIAAIEAQDTRVGRMLAAIDARPGSEDWLVVLTTDHGGHGTDHGPMDAANQTIPLVIWGGAVSADALDDAPGHLDVFPTVLAHFGADPSSWAHADGRSRLPGR